MNIEHILNGNLFKVWSKFVSASVIGVILNTIYTMVDGIFVGQGTGEAGLAGVNLAWPAVTVILGIGLLFGSGASSLISICLGSHDKERAERLLGTVLKSLLIIGVGLMILGPLFATPIIKFLGATEETFGYTKDYFIVIYLMAIPYLLANALNPLVRADGNPHLSMLMVGAGAIGNIILDWLFVIELGMGTMGAALATGAGVIFSTIIGLWYFLSGKSHVKFHKKYFKIDKELLKDIFKIGFPISMQDGLIQISFIIITIIANSRGVDIAAAVGVVEKIISFLFLVPSSMLSAISAICAQCVGTKQHQRARQTLRYGCFIALGFGIFFALTCQFISKEILSLFTSEAAVIMYGSQYLKGYVLDCVFASIHFCFSGFFTAYGYSIISFIHNVISIALIRVPGAYITSKLFPETLLPMGLTPALGSILSALICITVFIVMKKKNKFDF